MLVWAEPFSATTEALIWGLALTAGSAKALVAINEKATLNISFLVFMVVAPDRFK
jgi:hypothetical protein